MRPIIHIGYPKTATTWFQSNFFPQIENLDFIDRRRIVELFIFPTPFEFNPGFIRSELPDHENRRLLISHEELAGAIRRGGYNGLLTKEVAHRLKVVFNDADIVIMLRNQVDAIASSYIQYIRGGGTFCIDKYLIHPEMRSFATMHLFSLRHLEYHHVVSLYRELFGESNVYIYIFEEFVQNKNLFLENLINDFNFKMDFDRIDMKRRNASYRKFLKHLVQFSNLFFRGNVVNKHRIMNIPISHHRTRRYLARLNRFKIFGPYPTTFSILGKQNYDYLSEYYKTSNQILYSDFGVKKLKDFNYPLKDHQ